MKTLKEAKTYLRENFGKGCSCPACGQYVRQYKRRIGSSQSRMLIRLYHANKRQPEGYFHVMDLADGNAHLVADFAKLSYWNLILELKNDDPEKRTSGYWKLTHKGKMFVEGLIELPKYALVYNGKHMGFGFEGVVNILDCLGKKFNYKELMNG